MSTESTTGAPAPDEAHRADRRQLLRLGGTAAAAAAVGAATLAATASPAVAQGSLIPIYLPIGPIRMFDSRVLGTKIANGWTWKIDMEPLPAEIADCVNVTVTETVGAGWLAVFAGDETWPGNSSINWFASNQNLANNAYSWLGADGTLGVRCGGPATHFILDLVAISVLVDPTSPVTAFPVPDAVREFASRTDRRATVVDMVNDG